MDFNLHTEINPEKCTGCGACTKVCLCGTLSIANKKAIATGTACFNCGHCTAACPTGAITVTTLAKPVFKSFEMDDSWLGFGKGGTAELAQLMASLRSCRNFSDRPVPKEIIADLITIGSLAPSGSNQQGWSFTVLDQREQINALSAYSADFVRWSNRLARIAPLRKLLSRMGLTELQAYHDQYLELFSTAVAEWDHSGHDFIFYGAPCVILIEMERALGTPREDAILAAQNIRLAAHTLGLGSCHIGIAVEALTAFPDKRKKQFLNGGKIHAAIALGWPERAERYSRTIERKAVSPRYLRL